jgi:hypothetical protein
MLVVFDLAAIAAATASVRSEAEKMPAKKRSGTSVPDGYVELAGSERRASATARRLSPAEPTEEFTVTIVLRRRPDGQSLPTVEDFLNIPPSERPRMSQSEFASRYGASQEDIDAVTAFATDEGLAVVETNAARRTVVVRGTVEQMNRAFGVDLGAYELSVMPHRGGESQQERYRGREGMIYIPSALDLVVVGVFGLDNRSIGGRNGAEPPNTTTVTVPTVAGLYNYPTNSAAGQTIGIFSLDGYDTADITSFYGTLPASYTAPTITDVLIGGATNSGSDLFGEITQDIDLASAFAPGAGISVYLNNGGEQGWVDTLSRVAHPDPTDTPCSVFSSSYFLSDGDDASGMATRSVTTAMINAIHAALQDAAIQGVTVVIASGDRGTDSGVGDGHVHVQYPASDPWVLSVGGTTIGNVNGSSFDEYVWNDPDADPYHSNWGTTGGGVSAFFPVPAYQSGVAVPASLDDSTHHGRGVPDVAGNANIASGYSGVYVTGKSPQQPGNGTSAAAPQWAGLIAVMNAALGVNVGFVNPAIYALGGAGFRDIVPGSGPADNANSGAPGYPAGIGWDACTGWGSPDGQALLNNLRAIYTRNLYFIVDKSTFGLDEVNDMIATAGGVFTNAFWLVLEGFSINQVGGTVPTLDGAFYGLDGVWIFPNGAGPEYENPGDLYTPQRIRFPYDVQFTTAAVPGDFPAAGADPNEEPLNAHITVGSTTLAADAEFELVSGADPYFTNVDPVSHQAFYLSQDLRVFPTSEGETPVPGAPAITNDPYHSLQQLLHHLNTDPTYTTPGPDQLNGLPNQTGYETGDSSVTPVNPSGNTNFNFAVARVRLQGPAMSSATNVRVFFRLFVAQSCDTDFQPTTTYKSLNGTGAEANRPVFPQPSGTGLTDPQGNSLQTIPFFATDANGTHDYDGNNPDANVRTITIPTGHDKTWSYFGCYLDVYDASNQALFPGTHHCLVAQIAYDDAPIVNPPGITLSPENSDKIAQRNLQITSSGNPSYPDTHRVPQTFDTRPSQPATASGQLLDYPDELMIDWGNVPVGSMATIFWPQVDAEDVIALADRLYGAHHLIASEAHAIRCQTTRGVTYLPIPTGTGNYAGLFTIDLPDGLRVGNEFNIRVRRITSRRNDQKVVGLRPTAAAPSESRPKIVARNWRYVTGTFQVKIPVGADAHLLRSEQDTLAILKWRLQHFTHDYRWRPVLERYIDYVAKRVEGFGGNAGAVKPSLTGFRPHTKHEPTKPEVDARIGKISGLVFDAFGDFEGFWLESEDGAQRRFRSHAHQIEDLARRAWAERILVCVHTGHRDAERPLTVTYLRAPRPTQT